MTALTESRQTPRRDGLQFSDPVAAGSKIHEGAIVVLDASGDAKPGVTATDVTARGVAVKAADNTGGAAGAVRVEVRKGAFRFTNDGTVTRADIGGDAYIVDDQTVANSDGGATRSVAGEILDVDASGVWVQF